MFERIGNIWRKEFIDSLRDRKALRQAVLIPLILGVFYAAFNPWINSIVIARAQEPLTIPAQGIENAGQPFIDALRVQKITLKPFSGDLQAAIVKGDQAAGLIIPPGFGDNVSKEKPATLTLLTNRTSGGIFGGGFSGERLDLAVSNFSRAVVTNRVQERSLDPSLLTPINLDSHDLASPEQLAGVFAAFTLPILLGSIIAQGGLFVAIDTTAGEKERGTLESLLVTPASDLEVLVGKLGAVFTITCIPIVLTFLGFWVGGQLLPDSIAQGARLPLSVPVGAVLLSLPLALFIDVVLMIVSVRTKAFKDAQSAAAPMSIAVIAPAMAAAFITPTNAFMYLIPIYGPAALVGRLAIGTPIAVSEVAFAVVGSLMAAAVAFIVALRFFNRERMLYGV